MPLTSGRAGIRTLEGLAPLTVFKSEPEGLSRPEPSCPTRSEVSRFLKRPGRSCRVPPRQWRRQRRENERHGRGPEIERLRGNLVITGGPPHGSRRKTGSISEGRALSTDGCCGRRPPGARDVCFGSVIRRRDHGSGAGQLRVATIPTPTCHDFVAHAFGARAERQARTLGELRRTGDIR